MRAEGTRNCWERCVCGEEQYDGAEKFCTAQEKKRKRKVFKQQAMAEKKLDRPAMACVCDLR